VEEKGAGAHAHCNALQHMATHCNATSSICGVEGGDGMHAASSSAHDASGDDTSALSGTATHCNTLQRTATSLSPPMHGACSDDRSAVRRRAVSVSVSVSVGVSVPLKATSSVSMAAAAGAAQQKSPINSQKSPTHPQTSVGKTVALQPAAAVGFERTPSQRTPSQRTPSERTAAERKASKTTPSLRPRPRHPMLLRNRRVSAQFPKTNLRKSGV